MPRSASNLALLVSSLGACGLVIAITVSGCDGGRAPRRGPVAVGRPGAAASDDTLFNSIKKQLASLPERVQLELTPPLVVLDSRSSADGEEVRATLVRRPGAPSDSPANLIRVPKGNAGFRERVQSGDTLKYYVLLDDDTKARFEAEGEVDIATFDAQDLVVAQVLSDEELLIEGGFVREIVNPYKIEVWRVSDRRMKQIDGDLAGYFNRRDPPLAWHPSPDQDSIQQLTERLNQWLRQTRQGERKSENEFDPSAWIATLPESLADAKELAPYLSANALRDDYFSEYECRQVQGAIWRRDLARWARGADRAPAPTTTELLSWISRNVQLIEPQEDTPPRWPWELMLNGQADAAGRAWLLVGLCRQLNVRAAIVRAPIDGGERLLVGVVDGDQLRLFDPELGVPLPGEEEGSVGSLAELTASDAPLRALDLPGAPYPVNGASLEQAECFLVATPFELTRRALTLDARLTGDDAVVLSPPFEEVAEKLREVTGAGEVGLWSQPFQTLLAKLSATKPQRGRAVTEFLPFAWRPRLWKGRVLQFRGRRAEEGAALIDPIDGGGDDLRAAAQLLMHPSVRPSDSTLMDVTEDKRRIYRRAKTYATLWLGALHYEREQDAVVEKWLDSAAMNDAAAAEVEPLRRAVQAAAAERSGDAQRAADYLQKVEGPMAAAARLRAARLEGESTE